MKLWMLDVEDGETGDKKCAIIMAAHETEARSGAKSVDTVTDCFELDLEDSRWKGLHIVGQLIYPERF